MSPPYLLDSNVYIRAFRDATFGATLQEFHRRVLPRLVLSAVVATELLVGAQRTDRERALRRALIEPFALVAGSSRPVGKPGSSSLGWISRAQARRESIAP